jgi:ribosomal protein L35
MRLSGHKLKTRSAFVKRYQLHASSNSFTWHPRLKSHLTKRCKVTATNRTLFGHVQHAVKGKA